MYIEDLVASLLKSYDIDAVFIEDIQMRANVKAFKRLAQLQGVLVNLFERSEYLYGIIAPSQWQSFCKAHVEKSIGAKSDESTTEAGDKKKSKLLSIQFVKDQFGIETENDNLADAISIGTYIVNVVELEKPNKNTKKN